MSLAELLEGGKKYNVTGPAHFPVEAKDFAALVFDRCIRDSFEP